MHARTCSDHRTFCVTICALALQLGWYLREEPTGADWNKNMTAEFESYVAEVARIKVGGDAMCVCVCACVCVCVCVYHELLHSFLRSITSLQPSSTTITTTTTITTSTTTATFPDHQHHRRHHHHLHDHCLRPLGCRPCSPSVYSRLPMDHTTCNRVVGQVEHVRRRFIARQLPF
jgi:hypothetical protein